MKKYKNKILIKYFVIGLTVIALLLAVDDLKEVIMYVVG